MQALKEPPQRRAADVECGKEILLRSGVSGGFSLEINTNMDGTGGGGDTPPRLHELGDGGDVPPSFFFSDWSDEVPPTTSSSSACMLQEVLPHGETA